MADPVAAWQSEHADFRRLLALLQRQVEVFHTGERPNYELMLDIISYLREFADRFHHPREDAAFACLAKRFPEMKPDLARLSQEHRVIAQAGETLLKHLNAILAGAIVPRSEIEAAAATYLAYYGNHIAGEEEDVLTRAAKELTPADWKAVMDAAPGEHDPVFGDKPEARYRELRRRIALEA